MLKIIRLLKVLISKIFRANDNEVVKVDARANKIVKNLSKFKMLKNSKFENLTYKSNIEAIGKLLFLIFNTKKVLKHLQQVFIEASIL